MIDIKKWIVEGTGVKTEDTAFKKAVKTPFITFLDKQDVSGHDTGNCIVSHDLTVEYYNTVIDHEDERKIEALFDLEEMEYTKDREWINEDGVYMTIYTTEFTERKE